jgi:hypothetical protein
MATTLSSLRHSGADSQQSQSCSECAFTLLHLAGRLIVIVSPGMNKELEDIRVEYVSMCRLIGAQNRFHSSPQHDGSAHIEARDGEYHYVVTERGAEYERRATKDRDEVLYWLVSDVVFDLAAKYESKNRILGQSYRRLMFEKQVELMRTLRPEWALRRQMEIDKILEANPFDDAVEG